MITCRHGTCESDRRRLPSPSRSTPWSRFPVSATLAEALTSLRGPEDVTPLPSRSLHPPRARGARAPLADRVAARTGRPVRGDRRARSDFHCHGDPGRAVAAPRDRRLPDRARPDAASRADAADDGCVHPRRRERQADPCRPREGPHGRAGAAALRRCRPLVRGDGALARRAVRQRPRRPAARPSERHPRVRAGRGRRPRDHRREPGRRGRGGRRHARRARLRALLARGGRPGRRAAAGHRRPRRPARRDRLPGVDEEPARGAGRRVRARAGLRLCRGDAAGSGSPTPSSTSSPPARR